MPNIKCTDCKNILLTNMDAKKCTCSKKPNYITKNANNTALCTDGELGNPMCPLCLEANQSYRERYPNMKEYGKPSRLFIQVLGYDHTKCQRVYVFRCTQHRNAKILLRPSQLQINKHLVEQRLAQPKEFDRFD